MEPEFRTNLPRKKSLHPQTPEERLYEPEGVGLTLRKGDEVGNALSFSLIFSFGPSLSRALFQLLLLALFVELQYPGNIFN